MAHLLEILMMTLPASRIAAPQRMAAGSADTVALEETAFPEKEQVALVVACPGKHPLVGSGSVLPDSSQKLFGPLPLRQPFGSAADRPGYHYWPLDNLLPIHE